MPHGWWRASWTSFWRSLPLLSSCWTSLSSKLCPCSILKESSMESEYWNTYCDALISSLSCLSPHYHVLSITSLLGFFYPHCTFVRKIFLREDIGDEGATVTPLSTIKCTSSLWHQYLVFCLFLFLVHTHKREKVIHGKQILQSGPSNTVVQDGQALLRKKKMSTLFIHFLYILYFRSSYLLYLLSWICEPSHITYSIIILHKDKKNILTIYHSNKIICLKGMGQEKLFKGNEMRKSNPQTYSCTIRNKEN